MNGTWKQTDGGDSARGIGVVLAIMAAILAVEWLLARIWWILGGTAVVAVAVILAVRWLVRWQERREAAYGQQRAAIRAAGAANAPAGPAAQPAALTVHHHYGPTFNVATGSDLASVVRALPPEGTATEGE